MTKATISANGPQAVARVFPDPQSLRAIANSSRGSLEQIPFALLLRALSEGQRTCLLHLRRRDFTKLIQFESGVPIQCRSNVLHHTLGGYLITEQLISKEACDAATRDAADRGVPLGEVLIEAGLLTSDEVLAALQRLLAKSLLDAFTWPDGEFEIRPHRTAISAPLNVRVHQLILTGTIRFMPQEVVDRQIAAIGDTPLRWDSDRESDIEVRLGRSEQQLHIALADPTPISTLREVSGLDSDDLSRAVLALATLGILAPALESPSRPAPDPEPPPDETPAIQPTGSTIDAESLSALYLDHRRMTPYELLSADPNDSTETIERRYLEYTLGLSYWIAREQGSRAARAKAMELLLAGARAYSKVADEESRRRLAEAGTASPEQAGAIVEMLDSERQYQQGLELMESGQYENAYQKLQFASEADPQRGLYRAQAAYCRYLKTPEMAEEVLRSLQDTQRVDPTCGLAFLYAGEICGRLERFDEAQSLLRQAGKLMAPDRRPIEKLKELKERMKR